MIKQIIRLPGLPVHRQPGPRLPKCDGNADDDEWRDFRSYREEVTGGERAVPDQSEGPSAPEQEKAPAQPGPGKDPATD